MSHVHHERAAADRAVALLAELAGRAPRVVRLGPGATDAEIDGWGVPLPDGVRRLVRAVRAFRIGAARDGEWYSLAPERGLASGGWATGPPGSAHVVHEAGGDLLFVDVDGTSRAWGPVFAATGVFHETWAYAAPSLVAWVTGLARAGLAAVRANDDDEALLERLAEASRVVSYRPDLHGTPVPQARAGAGADPELASVLAALPDDALVVDLRDVPAPVTLHLPCPPALRGGHVEFQRRAGGRFAIGYPRTPLGAQTSRSTTTGA
ncbi:hypothetical protein OG607_08925 [Streptomyces sp. NBC_01537]|uniref:hypothetical protein n=1 Tax=Streptomyces sp. NBC_01537 TaxID=2903896 RepID=UPI00386742EC